MASGRLSELFGKEGLNFDKFALTMGYRRVAKQTWNDSKQLSKKQRSYFQAYADGINGFINGIGQSSHSTAWLLPPEFYAVGITDSTQIEPWHPIDSLAIFKLINFHLSWNWSNDLLRDIMSDLDATKLKSMVDEMVGFRADHMGHYG